MNTITTKPPVVTSYYTGPGVKAENLTISIVVDACATAMSADKHLVYTHCRKKNVKFARWMAWCILISHGYTYKEAGRLLGGHDHSTVLNALQKLPMDIERMDEVTRAWMEVKKYMHNGGE